MKRMYVFNDIAINIDFIERIERKGNSIFFRMQSGEKEHVKYNTKDEAEKNFLMLIDA
jgi:predicted aminopeptidase